MCKLLKINTISARIEVGQAYACLAIGAPDRGIRGKRT